MSGYLGIDIGGTASRYVLVDETGAEIARGAASGATGHLFNPAERARFGEVMEQIAREAGPQVVGVHMGVTGLGAKVFDQARALVAEQFGVPDAAVTASDDMELAFRAAFTPGTGHLVSAGTGSIGLHVARDGGIVRVGGRGLLIDDAGSGTWIALRALDAVYRRIDEFGTAQGAEALAEQLFTAIGGTDWDSTRAFVYAGDRGRIGTLAQAVARAADASDPTAIDILRRAGIELGRLGLALVARTEKLPIGFVGGIIGLHPAIQVGLKEALEGHEIVYPRIDAAAHAARMALAQQQEDRT